MNKSAVIFLGLIGVALGGCQKAEPEMTVQQLMAQHVQPTAKIYWDSVQFISDETGDHDIKPQTDAEWAKVRQAAVDLQKQGELLQTPEYTEGRQPNWSKFAQAMVDISKQAEQAAVDQDPDKVFEVGGTVYSVCSACHMAYPAESGAEAQDAAAS